MVEQVAREEMPLFSAVSRAYFADPRRALSAKGTRKAPLGFGSEAVEFILTPVVLAATAKAVECVADIVLQRTTGEGTGAALRRVFRLRQRPPGAAAADGAALDAASGTASDATSGATPGASSGATPATAPDPAPGALDAVPLRPEDLERLRHAVEATLRDCGTAPESARVITDAIIGRCQAPRTAG
ncbi:hypothetical protein GCM10018785_36940 [Streptomyces longispororuber]|uniref:Uncharacterized protein n=1 Tax=Streptomyces longispororuber TaxID=68230 RepID=A0A919DPD5_9ACTN|nr:hypothetical protein GCM10018785_36940 [Streptomyces longispororuber]